MDVQPERLKALLKNMVDIYSPSGKEEELCDYVHEYLHKHGLMVTRQIVDEDRCNLLVLPEKPDEIELLFIGHLDTVTAYDLDDYEFREEGDTIYGLGTADMKAGCAAMVEAFTVLAASEDSLPAVGLALVVDEEEDSRGAKTLIEEYRFPWAIIGEPTDLSPCLGHYGYLELLLRTEGKRAHSAMPELGENAIEGMLKLLLKVTEYLASDSHGLVYNVRELSGFPGGFVVPDACEAWLDLHLPPNSRMDTLQSDLEQRVQTMAEGIPGVYAQLRFEDTYSGYQISRQTPMVKKLRECYKRMSLPWHPQDFRSHSDGNVLRVAGVNPVILGPGRLEAAHTPEESVLLSQAVQAAQLYLDIARSI